MIVLAEGLVKRFGGSTDTRPIEPWFLLLRGHTQMAVIAYSRYVVCRRLLLAQLRDDLNIGVIGT